MTQPFQNTPFDLTQRAALITGAGVGIGRANAIALAQAGAVVGIHFHTSADAAGETLAIMISAKQIALSEIPFSISSIGILTLKSLSIL